VGADLCAVSRMKRAVENDYFVRKIFVAEEIEYAMAQGEPARHFAAAFAAREAFAKATGLGMFGMGLSSVWVRRTDNGPKLMTDGEASKKLKSHGADRCWLSLTHEGDFALAFVVLESAG
jgi:holo-[acyl-carrier protein] synthase